MPNFIFIKSDEKEFIVELKNSFDIGGLIKDKDKIEVDASILVYEMGFIWNLGNILDAFDYIVKVTEDGLDRLKRAQNSKNSNKIE